MSEDKTTETTQQEAPETNTEGSQPIEDEIVEIEWERVETVYQIRSALQETDDYMGRLMVDFEKRKKNLLARSAQFEEELYQTARALKDSFNLTGEFAYELKLPQKPGDKGYFVRKDEQ